MYPILKAVRARLTSDVVLTGIVNANDISTSHNAEYANYPCIALSIIGGSSSQDFDNITRARLNIDVFSHVNKEQLWSIYEWIKSLLHNQSRNLSDPWCVVHFIHEVNVSDNQYDLSNNVWHLTAEYEIFYSTAGLSITTGASGIVYANSTIVKAIPSNEVASFKGQLSLDIYFESNIRSERERFGKTAYFHSGMAKLSFSEMIFKASVLELLWNVGTEPSGKLNNGVTDATIYQVSQSSFPAYLQVLFQMVKTDDGKKLEIEADRAVCESLNIPFSKKDFCVFNCEWSLLGDNSGNVVKVAVEN